MDSASSLVIAADVVVYPVMTVRWVAAAPVLRRLFLDTAAAAAVVLDQRRPADSLTLTLTLKSNHNTDPNPIPDLDPNPNPDPNPSLDPEPNLDPACSTIAGPPTG